MKKEANNMEFIKSDLEKTSKNPDIDWIVVHQNINLYIQQNRTKKKQKI